MRAEKTALSSGSRADAAAAAHKQKHAEAVKAAAQALRKLASQDVQAVLRKFDLLYHGDEPNILHIGHEEKLLSNFHPPSGHTASYIFLVAVIVPSGIAVANLVPTPRILDNGGKVGSLSRASCCFHWMAPQRRLHSIIVEYPASSRSDARSAYRGVEAFFS